MRLPRLSSHPARFSVQLKRTDRLFRLPNKWLKGLWLRPTSPQQAERPSSTVTLPHGVMVRATSKCPVMQFIATSRRCDAMWTTRRQSPSTGGVTIRVAREFVSDSATTGLVAAKRTSCQQARGSHTHKALQWPSNPTARHSSKPEGATLEPGLFSPYLVAEVNQQHRWCIVCYLLLQTHFLLGHCVFLALGFGESVSRTVCRRGVFLLAVLFNGDSSHIPRLDVSFGTSGTAV